MVTSVKTVGNVPFNVINDGEAFSMHPGVMNACYVDGSTRTINDNVDLRVFAGQLLEQVGK